MTALNLYLMLAVIAVAYGGYLWARASRALTDLRKTRAAIPDLRKALHANAGRVLAIAALMLLLLWIFTKTP